MSDLFDSSKTQTTSDYSAKDIEVLEGLEPVRMRPGMYIGGTDERALHHLVMELIDNAMDEAVAGHASRIGVELDAQGWITVQDNGRGIPVDPHPKFPDKSALEVILTTLHSGGKFQGKAYKTSGGLHGVGLSVVNALSKNLEVEVIHNKHLMSQTYEQGNPTSKLEDKGPIHNRRGTLIRFCPDDEIFDKTAHFRPALLYRMVRSKAYLFRGVEIRWACAPELIPEDSSTPSSETLHFPNGLEDFLRETLAETEQVTPEMFKGVAEFKEGDGHIEWAMSWSATGDGFCNSYCNTVATPLGGTHENGFRQAITKSLRAYGDLVKDKKAAQLTADDVMGSGSVVISVFIREPQFQGQTKEKLVSAPVTRWVEGVLKDHFDHWLTRHKDQADALLQHVSERMAERLSRKKSKETLRQSATRRLHLPGKLSDCISVNRTETEIFLVEGDSAGGSAKQARDRKTQAVLPLRGKILNVASATAEKRQANQEISDLTKALGCGTDSDCDPGKLRYGRVIIMTDADVDGAHIASLLLTFFFQNMKPLLKQGSIYLAMPPLYRLVQGGKSLYARDDAHKDALLEKGFKGKSKIEISRFKGLGEMSWKQLKETTMDPETRTLLQVRLPHGLVVLNENNLEDPQIKIEEFVDHLMGRRPEKRFEYIQNNALSITELDV